MTKKQKKRTGSLAELAELMGISRSTAYRYRRTGKLHGLLDADGRITDLDAAAKTVAGRIKPKQQISANRRWKKENSPEPSEKEIRQYQKMTDADLEKLDIYELQRRNELEKLLLARLKRAEIEGTLINAETVKSQAAGCALTVKNGLAGMPDRLAALFAAETDAGKIRKMLKTEINQCLVEISKNIPD
jgi:hypothetical protein